MDFIHMIIALLTEGPLRRVETSHGPGQAPQRGWSEGDDILTVYTDAGPINPR